MAELPFHHDGMIALQEPAEVAGCSVATMRATGLRHDTFADADEDFVETAGSVFIACGPDPKRQGRNADRATSDRASRRSGG